MNGVHRQQEQKHAEQWSSDEGNEVEYWRVQCRDHGCREEDEEEAQPVHRGITEVRGCFGRGQSEKVPRALGGAEDMPEVGGGDCSDGNEWCHVRHELCASDIGEVGQHRDVVFSRLLHSVSAQRHHTGPHEEHREGDQQNGGEEENLRGFLLRAFPKLALHIE